MNSMAASMKTMKNLIELYLQTPVCLKQTLRTTQEHLKQPSSFDVFFPSHVPNYCG